MQKSGSARKRANQSFPVRVLVQHSSWLLYQAKVDFVFNYILIFSPEKDRQSVSVTGSQSIFVLLGLPLWDQNSHLFVIKHIKCWHPDFHLIKTSIIPGKIRNQAYGY